MHASGTFDVDLQPLDCSVQGEHGVRLGRLAIVKQFHGDLQAASRGEMLSARTSVEGSAGYVAIEQVNGTLAGRQGSFVLQHFGTMTNGQGRLILEVVPGSGSGKLAGLTGAMEISVVDGAHRYEFDYALPAA